MGQGYENKKFLGITLSENVLRRNMAAAMVIIFFAMFALMLSITFFQDFIITYCGINKDFISRNVGYFMAFYNLSYFVTAPLWGRLSDKIGRRKVTILCFSVGAISFLLMGLTASFWQMFAAKMFLGVCMSGGVSIVMAAAADYTQPRERGKVMGTFGTFIGVAAFISIPSGAILYDIYYYLPFMFQATLFITCAILSFLLLKAGLPNKQVQHAHTTQQVAPSEKKPFLQLFKIPRLRFSYMIAFLLGAGPQLDMVAFLPWGEYIAGIERGVLGQYLSISAALFTFLVIIAGWLSKKYGNFRVIMFGVTGLLLCYLIAGLMHNYTVIIIAYIAIAAFKAFAYPGSLVLAANEVSHENRGTSMGFYHSLRSMGEISFSLLCGILFSWFSNNLGNQYALLGGFLFPIIWITFIVIFGIYLVKTNNTSKEHNDIDKHIMKENMNIKK